MTDCCNPKLIVQELTPFVMKVFSGPPSRARWGEITGTLAAQSDLQAVLDDLQEQINELVPASNNVFYPEAYGAKGDATGDNSGSVLGGSFDQFYSPFFTFTNEWIGKKLYFDTTERTIQSINGSGYAVFTPAYSANVGGLLWLAGTDDTVAIQTALDHARDVQGQDIVENPGGMDGMVRMGGVCELRAGKAYIIGNSQAQYNAGKLSCLKVSRRTDFRGAGLSFGRSQLCLKPNSYGHMVANNFPGDQSLGYTDYVAIGRMNLWGYQSWSPNSLNGIHWYVAFNGYDKVDTYNRFYDVGVYRTKGDGMFFRGRGELIIENCQTFFAGQYGFNIFAEADYKIIGCNTGGNSKTGMRIFAASAGHYIGCKSFYNGAAGGSNAADCANWYVNADQMRTGLCYFTDCEGQESRGSSWVVDNAGLCQFVNCQGLDPGRAALSASGTLPTNINGLTITGNGAIDNNFINFKVGPSVAIFDPTNNWGNATDAYWIADVNAAGGGPQNNTGSLNSMEPSINVVGALDRGIDYRPGYGPVGGGGFTNGRNWGLKINECHFVSTIPAAPVNLTGVIASGQYTLNFDQYFTGGGIPVTDYLVQYKLHSDSVWTTFNHAPITAGPITITGLTNNQFYDFQLAAINALGTGPFAQKLNVQILVTAPAQVTGLTATAGSGFVGLSWTVPFDGNSAITDYLVEYKASSSGTWLTLPKPTSTLTTQYQIDTLNIAYDYRVSAINAVGTGTASAVVSATPTLALCNFDASDLTALSPNTPGGTVTNFTDPNGYVATQATASFRPLTGVNTLNGKNVLTFDGTNDFLQCILPVTGFLAGVGYANLFCTMKCTGTTGTRNAFAYTTSNGVERLLDINVASNKLSSIGKMAVADIQFVMTSTNNVNGVATLSATRVRQGQQGRLYSSFLSSTIVSSGFAANNGFVPVTDQRIVIGTTLSGFGYFIGDFAQAAIHGGNMTDAQYDGVGRAYAYKWGQTWKPLP